MQVSGFRKMNKLFYTLLACLVVAFLVAILRGCNLPLPSQDGGSANVLIKDSIRALKQDLAAEKTVSDSLKRGIVVFEVKLQAQKQAINIVYAKYNRVRQENIKLTAVGSVALLARNMGGDSILPIHLANGDTVCDITIAQVKTLNGTYIDRNECYEVKDSLNATIENYGMLVGKKDSLIFSLDKQIGIQDTIIGKYGRVVVNDSLLINKQDRKIKALKWQRNGSVLLLVVSCLLFVL